MTSGQPPVWVNRLGLQRHFRKHGPKLGLRTIDDYERSARDTVRTGLRFTYVDRATGLPRVGYYDPATRLFTAVTDDETEITSHFPTDARYLHGLPASTYP